MMVRIATWCLVHRKEGCLEILVAARRMPNFVRSSFSLAVC